jgi:hypothetical protein
LVDRWLTKSKRHWMTKKGCWRNCNEERSEKH